MIEHLKRLIGRVRASAAWRLPPPLPPEDPDAGVREPVRRRPSRGGAAVALAEPDEFRHTVAVEAFVRDQP